jgi:hypothetical protein
MKNKYLLLTSIILIAIVSFLVYQQFFTNYYPSDSKLHINILNNYFSKNNYYIPHPLWHLTTFILSKISFLSVEYSAVIVSAFYVWLWYILVYFFIKNKLSNIYTSNILILISSIVIIIGPLCIPWYNKLIFLGQGSPNIWHNVTLWTVKPFALLATWYSIEGLAKQDTKKLILATVFTLISIFAKPSFIIMFLPALLIYALATKEIKDILFIKFYMILSTLSILILLYQYTHTFNKDEGKIIIDFLGVWSLYSPNIAVSIILALAFPLSFVVLESDILNDKYILISWIMIFVSVIYYATFAQTGRFYSHGNFGWSYMIAMSLLYLFSIVKFFEIYESLHFIKKIILSVLLFLQTIIGVYYLYHILIGQNPLYIAIFL